MEGGVQALLFQDLNRLTIGGDCMISNTVVFRGGEHPHLIFDADTGDYLDTSEGIELGDHVWVGEGAYITKRAAVASGSIVAARAVLTRRFSEEQIVVAGNPAEVARRRILWARGRSTVEDGSKFQQNYRSAKAEWKASAAEQSEYRD